MYEFYAHVLSSIQASLPHCLHPSTPLVCRLLLLALTTAALLLEAAVGGACVGVLLSAFSLLAVAGAMLSLLSGRREAFEPEEAPGAVLVRGSLLLAAAWATDRPPGLLWP